MTASYDLTLLGLAHRALKFAGHIENMSEEERVLLLGMFAGAVVRLQENVRALYKESDKEDNTEALFVLHQVMLALGAGENWKDEGR
jgi:hypothetical protein